MRAESPSFSTGGLWPIRKAPSKPRYRRGACQRRLALQVIMPAMKKNSFTAKIEPGPGGGALVTFP